MSEITFELESAEPIIVEVIQLDKTKERTEFVFTYRGDNGAVLTFYTNPTSAWSCVVVGEDTNELGFEFAERVVQKFCDTAIDALMNDADLRDRLTLLRV